MPVTLFERRSQMIRNARLQAENDTMRAETLNYEHPAQNSAADVTRYREMVGSLIYAMMCSRPDLAYIVTKLSQSLANPSQGDWITVKHVYYGTSKVR